MLWHSSVVVFLSNLYQLPDPTPPMNLFPSSFLAKSLGKVTSRRFLLAAIAHIYGVFSKCERSGLLPDSPFSVSCGGHIRVLFTIDVSI
jgi:hypothetical protein